MLALISEAIRVIAQGGMVIVVDDEGRENEGDVLMAAEHVTDQAVAFMMRECRGLICAPLTGAIAGRLDLPPMVDRNRDPMRTAFTVSVDLITGTSSGISAADRSKTLRALADPRCAATDLSRPGHVFPLVAKPGGVLERPGHTEAAVDLAVLAGCAPVGVICEIALDDGSMARRPDLDLFARRHGLIVISIADLIAWRRTHGLTHLSHHPAAAVA